MTLSFTQTINGKPNYFIEKISCALIDSQLLTISDYQNYRFDYNNKFGKDWDDDFEQSALPGKLHTIREDSKNRWGAGCDIHLVINNRTPKRFQFAPVIKCKSVQMIEIKYSNHKILHGTYNLKGVNVFIDGIELNSTESIEKLALNDGFDSPEDFFAYFNKDFTGKIIHWTDLKY
jgi:hypothetical protein